MLLVEGAAVSASDRVALVNTSNPENECGVLLQSQDKTLVSVHSEPDGISKCKTGISLGVIISSRSGMLLCCTRAKASWSSWSEDIVIILSACNVKHAENPSEFIADADSAASHQGKDVRKTS